MAISKSQQADVYLYDEDTSNSIMGTEVSNTYEPIIAKTSP